MEIITHTRNNIKIAEVVAPGVIVANAEDGLDLLGNLYYQGFDKIILHEKNITPDFFLLKNGLAGEILQKFSNYRVGLSIVGDFAKYSGQSIRDFIYECNKGNLINFVSSVDDGLTGGQNNP